MLEWLGKGGGRRGSVDPNGSSRLRQLRVEAGVTADTMNGSMETDPAALGGAHPGSSMDGGGLWTEQTPEPGVGAAAAVVEVVLSGPSARFEGPRAGASESSGKAHGRSRGGGGGEKWSPSAPQTVGPSAHNCLWVPLWPTASALFGPKSVDKSVAQRAEPAPPPGPAPLARKPAEAESGGPGAASHKGARDDPGAGAEVVPGPDGVVDSSGTGSSGDQEGGEGGDAGDLQSPAGQWEVRSRIARSRSLVELFSPYRRASRGPPARAPPPPLPSWQPRVAEPAPGGLKAVEPVRATREPRSVRSSVGHYG